MQNGRIQCNNQPNYLQIAILTGRIDGEENAVVLGDRGEELDPSAAMAVMGGLISRGGLVVVLMADDG